jgi:hypothetical protein
MKLHGNKTYKKKDEKLKNKERTQNNLEIRLLFIITFLWK